ncbi:MAG: hypothetical protein ACT4QC_23265 [Planctomycetaceae bacterium]
MNSPPKRRRGLLTWVLEGKRPWFRVAAVVLAVAALAVLGNAFWWALILF